MFTFLKQYFHARSLRQFEETAARVAAREGEVKGLSDEELRVKSRELGQKVRDASSSTDEEVRGEETEELKVEAFALAREAARRTLGQRPYDVQVVGGLVLHRGAIAEMATGEGKTLAAVAPAYFNALRGKGVHIVTVNEYLARRDAVWMGQIYHALGLSAACLTPQGAFLYDPAYRAQTAADPAREGGEEKGESELADEARDTTGAFLVQQEYLRPVGRREAYLADVTYGTNHEFGFDYLRDNLSHAVSQQVQRSRHFAIIDEVDSILIDEARTPLIIAAPDVESSEHYKTFARVVTRLQAEEDYAVDEKFRTVSITDAGIEKAEALSGVRNLYAPENLRFVHYLEESLKAKALFTRDKDYVVKDGEVVIVDEFTGRLLRGRRYNGGLHQAIEAKEGVGVKEESRTYAKISIQNYFRTYEKISGMTGTAQTSAEEFHKVYGLDVYTIPTNKPSVRRDFPDRIYKNAEAKFNAVIRDIEERQGLGQPVLVGTTSIAKNEVLSAKLSRAGVPHEVLNAKNNEREGAIIAQAGRPGAVTVATNMAGRGVDIVLGGNPPSPEEAHRVKAVGGLYVVGTERHEARRIDNQLRGRSARQGDPGQTQFYLSLDDDLLRIFGGERIRGLMDRFNLPEDEPIQLGFVSKAVAEAQAKVEGANFDMRKHLLEYDDVLNKQRGAVYKMRQEILSALNVETLGKIIFGAAFSFFEKLWAAGSDGETDGDPEALSRQNAVNALHNAGIATPERPAPDAAALEGLREFLGDRSREAAGHERAGNFLLSILDLLWMSHLEDLEALQESVNLRAYGQHDPLVEFKREAHALYRKFWGNFNEWVFMNIFRLTESAHGAPDAGRETGGSLKFSPTLRPPASNVPTRGVGRNAPCPCGAINPATGHVYKYKKCGMINAPYHKK